MSTHLQIFYILSILHASHVLWIKNILHDYSVLYIILYLTTGLRLHFLKGILFSCFYGIQLSEALIGKYAHLFPCDGHFQVT